MNIIDKLAIPARSLKLDQLHHGDIIACHHEQQPLMRAIAIGSGIPTHVMVWVGEGKVIEADEGKVRISDLKSKYFNRGYIFWVFRLKLDDGQLKLFLGLIKSRVDRLYDIHGALASWLASWLGPFVRSIDPSVPNPLGLANAYFCSEVIAWALAQLGIYIKGVYSSGSYWFRRIVYRLKETDFFYDPSNVSPALLVGDERVCFNMTLPCGIFDPF